MRGRSSVNQAPGGPASGPVVSGSMGGSARAEFSNDGQVDTADFAACLNEFSAAQP
jgi:hypothetical protein